MTGVTDLVQRGVLRAGVPLGPLTTYKAGGPAKWFAQVSDVATLEELVASGVTSEYPVLVLGRGSNLVVADAGFDGLVVQLAGSFGEIRVGSGSVVGGGAAPLPRVARAAVDAGLLGLEFFVGIPGSVGGAVRQNAGCFGRETKDVLVAADLFDLREGSSRRATPKDLGMGYRHSNVSSSEVVVEAVFAASPGDRKAGREEIRRITRWRKEHQPGGTLNAGSVFKNPPGEAAGEIIDRLGLKGLRVGDVRVSEKHANFFVAGPAARAADIYRLVEEVKDRVFAATGTMLETEIQFVGFEE